jgi:uncharacterized protein YbjT (DUF2867 family)
MRVSIGLAVIAIESIVSGSHAGAQSPANQSDAATHTKRKEIASGLGAVTGQDATVVFGKIQSAFVYVLAVKPGVPSGIKNSSAPIDRKEVISEFIRLREMASPAFRMKLRPARYDKSRWSWNTPDLESLVKEGYVAPLGPLTTKKSSTLTPAEFGDALGFFLSRISQVTHQPSTKWTPYLQQSD